MKNIHSHSHNHQHHPFPAHGSPRVQEGKLTGSTDTDYFYFFCPDGECGKIVRILDMWIRDYDLGNPYNDQCSSEARIAFTLEFHIHCESCGLDDLVKLSNTGWQGGSLRSSVLGNRLMGFGVDDFSAHEDFETQYRKYLNALDRAYNAAKDLVDGDLEIWYEALGTLMQIRGLKEVEL